MSSITLRKQPSGCAAFLLWMIYVFFIVIYIFTVSICLNPAHSGGMEPYVGYIIIAVATLMILLPIILSVVKRFRYARIKYVLTKEEMLCYEGKKLVYQIPRVNIQLFGSYTLGRNAWLFFCTASTEEIASYADANWEKRFALFSKSQIDILETTTMGVWQMKVTLYLQFAINSFDSDVITVEFQDQQVIKDISTLWETKPFLAGSYAIEHAAYYSGTGPF